MEHLINQVFDAAILWIVIGCLTGGGLGQRARGKHLTSHLFPQEIFLCCNPPQLPNPRWRPIMKMCTCTPKVHLHCRLAIGHSYCNRERWEAQWPDKKFPWPWIWRSLFILAPQGSQCWAPGQETSLSLSLPPLKSIWVAARIVLEASWQKCFGGQGVRESCTGLAFRVGGITILLVFSCFQWAETVV